MPTCSKCGKEYSAFTARGLGAGGICNACKDAQMVPGVRGWLLLLCLGMTIVSPVLSGLGVLNNLRALSGAPSTRGIHGYDMLDVLTDLPRSAATIIIIVDAAMIVFSIVAGLYLWTRRRGAVAVAKSYMVAQLVASFAPVLLVLSSIRDATIRQSAIGVTGASVVYAALWFAIWFTYLVKSRRVRITYVESPDGATTADTEPPRPSAGT